MTPHLYLTSTYLFKHSATLKSLITTPESLQLIFDSTIFHPQGGGQPSDSGTITINSTFYPVTQLSVLNNQVVHHIENKGQIPQVNTEYSMEIDSEKRKINARLHSGGHLIDIVVAKLGLQWLASKGYHFPDSPYVEYQGQYEKTQENELIQQMNQVLEDMRQVEEKVEVKTFGWDSVPKDLELPSYLEGKESIRWVKLLEGDQGCPCGGTHVEAIKEIGVIKVTKLVKKKKNVRVCYVLE